MAGPLPLLFFKAPIPNHISRQHPPLRLCSLQQPRHQSRVQLRRHTGLLSATRASSALDLPPPPLSHTTPSQAAARATILSHPHISFFAAAYSNPNLVAAHLDTGADVNAKSFM